MTPRLSEVLAWERIARAFAAFAVTAKRTKLTRYGLCYAVLWVSTTLSLNHTMWARLGRFRPYARERRHGSKCWWPCDAAHAAPRALFAQLMAELAREEQG